MRKRYQSPVRMKNSSYYIAPVGDWTHDIPHTVVSNMVNVSPPLTLGNGGGLYINKVNKVTWLPFSYICASFSLFRVGHPITVLRYTDKRIANMMKVYTEINKLQLELLRWRKHV